MAVQFVPLAEGGKSFSQKLNSGLGKALPQAMQLYEQHEAKQQQTNQMEQKRKDEQAKELRGYEHDINKIQTAEKLKGEYKHKSKAEEIAVKLVGEEKINKELKSFADKLEAGNPGSPIHKTLAEIYRTDLPFDEKKKLAETLTGIDPFKADQQKRLQLDSTLKRYNTVIKSLDDEISNHPRPYSDEGKVEITQLRHQRMKLRSERDQLLDIKGLNGYEDEEDEETEEDEVGGPKPMFDPNNKEHKAKAEQLFKKFGDKEKVRQALKREFKGL